MGIFSRNAGWERLENLTSTPLSMRKHLKPFTPASTKGPR
jgi:hypothetical protein